MICHIFLPMIYCFKCLWKYQPDIFYDTTGILMTILGFAFNCLLVKILLPFTECRAYVHYPFISEDMIAKIKERRADFNNN
jgi:alpha-1,2-mannosyltransferase